MKINFSKNLLAASIMSVSAALSVPVLSQSNTASNIVGSIQALEGDADAQYTVTATNRDTGMGRSIVTRAGEKFRLAQLPVGVYQVVVSRDGAAVVQRTVRVSLGSNANADFDMADNMEEVVVQGQLITSVDTYTMDSGLVLSEAAIDAMPVARNINAVALLAPGVIGGDSGFGSGNSFSAVSFGGSSIAENSVYINGLEVTNTRQGINASTVPFEFYKEFQVKTGGYSAEFGRTTGGAVNAVTKSGGNTWEFGSSVYWEPDALRSTGNISRGEGGVGDVFRNTTKNESDTMSYTFSASGPIIEDKLFFYGLINPRDTKDHYAHSVGAENGADVQFRERESSGADNLFWGAKIDWDVSDNHRLSYFGFSDRRELEEEFLDFDANTGTIGNNVAAIIDPSLVAGRTRTRGSLANSLSYTGYFGNDLTISAMAGQIETEYTDVPWLLDCPSIRVSSAAEKAGITASSCGGGSFGDNLDENIQYRLDINYVLGDHTLKGGVDIQERTSTRLIAPVGGHSWSYDLLEDGGSIQGSDGPLFVNDTGAELLFVEDRIFEGGGDFKSDLTAFYLEDQWQITDDLQLSIGLRKDLFEGEGVDGTLMFDFDTDIAPRLGFSWDPVGDGESKVYGTWGRYYLPIANNTIFRAGAGISDTTTFYTFTDVDPIDGSPINIDPITGDLASSTVTNSVPVVPSREVFQSQEADPFARDELILGYETSLNDNLAVGIRGVYREVTSALDDYCGSFAEPFCVLLNPGQTSSWFKDENVDGIADPGSLTEYSRDTIGLPDAKNEYRAIQTDLTYTTEKMNWKFIYTWSRSTGNFEGAVKSDIDQADAGITQDFDFPALMDGAEGYQANDRRHVFKAFGNYYFSEDLSFGLNASLSSGRPLSAFGKGYPSTDPNIFGNYGDTFYILQEDGSFDFLARGEAGRTPWIFNVDASARYQFEVSGVDMVASLDIFNILNNQEATNINEHFESAAGTENLWYNAAYDWNRPRSARLGLQVNF